jgi:hypothetical protein
MNSPVCDDRKEKRERAFVADASLFHGENTQCTTMVIEPLDDLESKWNTV